MKIHKITLVASLPDGVVTADVVAFAGRLCERGAKYLRQGDGEASPSLALVDRSLVVGCTAMVLRTAIEQAVDAFGGTMTSLSFDTEDGPHTPPRSSPRPRGRHRRDH